MRLAKIIELNTFFLFTKLLQQDDVINVTELLLNCHQYYESMKLSNDCVNKKCQVPNECAQHNAVYNIFHFLADTEFINVKLLFLFLPSSYYKTNDIS